MTSWPDDGTSTVRSAAALETLLRTYTDSQIAALPTVLNGWTVSLEALGAKADGGTTENAAIINAVLANMGNGGTAMLSGKHTQGFGIKHPIIIPGNVTLFGEAAQGGGCQLAVQAAFPHTTINGAQTTPASNATTFTLTVASTTNFPMASGGIPLANGQGIICVQGCTIFYTGVTPTTFTGCQTNDVNVTLANAAAVSTFAVWMCEPGATNTGFSTRFEGIKIACANIAGVSGICSQHLQQNAGIFNMHADGVANFGIRIESNPTMTGNDQPVNWCMSEIDLQFSSSVVEATAVGVDLFNAYGAANKPNQPMRGIENLSVYAGSSKTVKAGLRLNGATGRYVGIEFEQISTGVLIGDLVKTQGVVLDVVSAAGSGFANAVVEIANIAGNSVDIRSAFKSNPATVTSRVLIKDDINSVSRTDSDPIDYQLFGDGSYSFNGGPRVYASLAITYSASMTPDGTKPFQTITVTNTTAMTINAPTSPVTGASLTFDILNSIGGGSSVGVITWNAVFKLAGAFVNPADTKRRTISFYYNGTNWVETNRAAADI